MTATRRGLPRWSLAVSPRLEAAEVLMTAHKAEQLGFDGLWLLADREAGGIMPGPLSMLGALAQRTRMLLLGAVVGFPGAIAPSVLAKNLTTLDRLSHGRMVLAVVPAVDRGGGLPAPTGLIDEAIEVCRLMLTRETSEMHGRWFRISQAVNRPPPVQPQGPAIVASATLGPGAPEAEPDAVLESYLVAERPSGEPTEGPIRTSRRRLVWCRSEEGHWLPALRRATANGPDGVICQVSGPDEVAEVAASGAELGWVTPGDG